MWIDDLPREVLPLEGRQAGQKIETRKVHGADHGISGVRTALQDRPFLLEMRHLCGQRLSLPHSDNQISAS